MNAFNRRFASHSSCDVSNETCPKQCLDNTTGLPAVTIGTNVAGSVFKRLVPLNGGFRSKRSGDSGGEVAFESGAAVGDHERQCSLAPDLAKLARIADRSERLHSHFIEVRLPKFVDLPEATSANLLA